MTRVTEHVTADMTCVTEHITADTIHVTEDTEKQNTPSDKNTSSRYSDSVTLMPTYYLLALVWPTTMEPSCNGSQFRVSIYLTFIYQVSI
jgi:hypothetical protein